MEKDAREEASSALSDYSSCDESEFDRYSSANSFLGTSSLCSSMGNYTESMDFFGGTVGKDKLDWYNGREKFLKGSSRNDNGANSNGVYCLYNGVSDDQKENCPKEEEERAVWRSRIRTWSKSLFGLNGNLGKQMNVGEIGMGKEDGVLLPTISFSFPENGAAFGNRERSGGKSSKEKQVIACEGIHDLGGKPSPCHKTLSSGHCFYGALSGEAARWGVFDYDGGDSTLELCLDDEDGRPRASYSNINLVDHADKRGFQFLGNKKISGLRMKGDSAGLLVGESKFAPIPLIDNVALGFSSSKTCQVNDAEVIDDHDLTKMGEKNSLTVEAPNLDADEYLDDVFFDMEGISHNSEKSHFPKYSHGKKSRNIRDGSSTASTSLAHKVYPLVPYHVKIDSIKVVGSKQKTGEVSLGERLIGVKEYTVYKIQVQSGKDQWEIERRYRDFLSLYCQLNSLFNRHDLPLPSPWSKVEESRKYFGNTSQNVINERTTLIQDCLCSILSYNTAFGIPSSFFWFLSPTKDLLKSNFLNILVPESFQRLRDEVNLNSSYGDSISTSNEVLSLVVDVVPQKPINQLLEKQHYTCAGCDKTLDAEKSLMQDFIFLLGWCGPRLCEYTGQIFCPCCHTGDTSILPAKVLHHWDFSLRPVSRLAKVYLESIHDKPVLCLRAVNPSLFEKIQALHHVVNIRKKIESLFPFVRCSFRSSLERALGPRKYLLENNDIFSLRDLVDISKGAFSGLPAIIETVLSKIFEHIMQQCLTCYNMGIPCAARESCRSTSPLIFLFEEAEVIVRPPCGFIFHEPCIEHLDGCPCGKLVKEHLKASVAEAQAPGGDVELGGFVDSPLQKPDKKSAAEYISDLLSMARPEKLWKPWNRKLLLVDF